MKKGRQKKKREQGPLERKVARAVTGAILQQEETTRAATAKLAGHGGSWLTRWLDGDQTATLDDMQIVVMKTLRLPIAAVLNTPDEASALDWEVFALILNLTKTEDKELVRDTVRGLVRTLPNRGASMPTAATGKAHRRGGR